MRRVTMLAVLGLFIVAHGLDVASTVHAYRLAGSSATVVFTEFNPAADWVLATWGIYHLVALKMAIAVGGAAVLWWVWSTGRRRGWGDVERTASVVAVASVVVLSATVAWNVRQTLLWF